MISGEYGWTDDQILDLTISRIKQVQDVILTRRRESLRQELTYKEIEIRQITTAIHSAAGSQAGAKAASQFQLPKPGDEVTRKVASPEKVARVFGGTAPEFSQEAIAALAAQQKAA